MFKLIRQNNEETEAVITEDDSLETKVNLIKNYIILLQVKNTVPEN